jgi:hypothetical protein
MDDALLQGDDLLGKYNLADEDGKQHSGEQSQNDEHKKPDLGAALDSQ